MSLALSCVLALLSAAPAARLRPPLQSMAEVHYRLIAGAVLAVETDPPAIRLRVDTALRGDAADELRLRVPPAPYDRRDRRRVEQFVLSAQAPPRARARLLLLAHDRRPLLGQWAPAAAGVLARLPVLSEPPAPVQALVEAALRVLAAHPQQVESAPLTAWLGSTPVLAELAAAVLRAQSPAGERAALDSVLARPLLPVATRGFLEQHRQRLQWAAAATGVDSE